MEQATIGRATESANPENELNLLEAIEAMPETTQADLATQVGVAVGTVNWYLKRWSKKGYVKVSRIGRWKWSYLLTPQGILHKTTLAREYVDASLSLYRRVRNEAKRMIIEAKHAGFDTVLIQGKGEIAEICQLTCLEHQMNFIEANAPHAGDLNNDATSELVSNNGSNNGLNHGLDNGLKNTGSAAGVIGNFDQNELRYPIIQIENTNVTLIMPS